MVKNVQEANAREVSPYADTEVSVNVVKMDVKGAHVDVSTAAVRES